MPDSTVTPSPEGDEKEVSKRHACYCCGVDTTWATSPVGFAGVSILVTIVALVWRIGAHEDGNTILPAATLPLRRLEGALGATLSLIMMLLAVMSGSSAAGLYLFRATEEGRGRSIASRCTCTPRPGSVFFWLGGGAMVPTADTLLDLLRLSWLAFGLPSAAIACLYLVHSLDPTRTLEEVLDVTLVGSPLRPFFFSAPWLLHCLDVALVQIAGQSWATARAWRGPTPPAWRQALEWVVVRLGDWRVFSGFLVVFQLVNYTLVGTLERAELAVPLSTVRRVVGVGLFIFFLAARRHSTLRQQLAFILPVGVLGAVSVNIALAESADDQEIVDSPVTGQSGELVSNLIVGIMTPVAVYMLHLSQGAKRASSLLHFLRYLSHEVRVPANVTMLAIGESVHLLNQIAGGMGPGAEESKQGKAQDRPPSMSTHRVSFREDKEGHLHPPAHTPPAVIGGAATATFEPGPLTLVAAPTARDAVPPAALPSLRSGSMPMPVDSAGVGHGPSSLSTTPALIHEASDVLFDAQEALLQLQALLNRTLDLARLEAGAVKVVKGRFTLARLYSRIRSIGGSAYNGTGVTLDMPPGPPEWSSVYLVGDTLRLQQAAVNVLHNGSKYSPTGSTVTCRAKVQVESEGSTPLSQAPAEDDERVWLTLTVADTGRGMTGEEMDRVFVPFSRLHSGKEGTGLGLNIAKKAMQAHGGDLTVASPGLGKGCTFTIHVPLDRATSGGGMGSGISDGSWASEGGGGRAWLPPTMLSPHSSMGGKTASSGTIGKPPTPAAAGVHVLVVDDDPATRRMVSRILRRSSGVREVTVAEDGRAAVAAWKAARDRPLPISHITLDNQMPVMTGLEAAAALRQAGCKARIVGLTGNTVGADTQNFLDAGADSVLGKPVKREAIVAALGLHQH